LRTYSNSEKGNDSEPSEAELELAKKIYDPVLVLLKELQAQNEERD
jgi:hypothetical protein